MKKKEKITWEQGILQAADILEKKGCVGSDYGKKAVENVKEYDFSTLTFSDKWILTRLNKTISEVRKNMDKYEFQNVGTELYNFIWDDFCDGYIEFSKFNMDNESTKSTLLYVLTNILKLLHPFMPFVTEEI